jgi:hypothetical protein
VILLGEISGRCGFLRSTRATARIAMAPQFSRLEGSAGPPGAWQKRGGSVAYIQFLSPTTSVRSICLLKDPSPMAKNKQVPIGAVL